MGSLVAVWLAAFVLKARTAPDVTLVNVQINDDFDDVEALIKFIKTGNR